jgi:hypothetical protein
VTTSPRLIEANHRTAAVKLGLSFEEYRTHVEAGRRFCWDCREWLPADDFARDANRPSGRKSQCRACCNRDRRESEARRRGEP